VSASVIAAETYARNTTDLAALDIAYIYLNGYDDDCTSVQIIKYTRLYRYSSFLDAEEMEKINSASP
jgi:hypothetical protein